MKYLIVGLGNPGAEYAQTRHNIGFDVLDQFVNDHTGVFLADRLADLAQVKLKGKHVYCIKPSTFMNLSGKAVKYWMDKLRIPPDRLLVIVDEIAIPLSKLRLKPSGSSGGHNGLKSIEEMLGTTFYPRLRFGIGNDYPKGRQSDYVLGKWSAAEWPLVKVKMDKSVKVIESFVLQGITQTMNEINNKEFSL
ncbi:MAG: aminoacyl-tRNA hydrolase [Terrimonas sp.]|nr:aminoacyl-tRNA hydrolase [Terrimonas sp.]